MGSYISVFISEDSVKDLQKGRFDTVVSLVKTELRYVPIFIDEDRIKNKEVPDKNWVSIDARRINPYTKKRYGDEYGLISI